MWCTAAARPWAPRHAASRRWLRGTASRAPCTRRAERQNETEQHCLLRCAAAEFLSDLHTAAARASSSLKPTCSHCFVASSLVPQIDDPKEEAIGYANCRPSYEDLLPSSKGPDAPPFLCSNGAAGRPTVPPSHRPTCKSHGWRGDCVVINCGCLASSGCDSTQLLFSPPPPPPPFLLPPPALLQLPLRCALCEQATCVWSSG